MKSKKALLGIIMFLLMVVFTGCKSTDIVQLSPDTYMITVEDHAGIFGGSATALKDRTIHKANAFAESKGKIAIPVSIQSHPVGVLADWASCEYQFMVLDKNDPQAIRTPLIPQADPGVELQQQMQRRAIMQQSLAISQQQIQNNINSLQQSAAESQRTVDNLELQQVSHPFVLPPGQPTIPNAGLMSQPNLMGQPIQQQPLIQHQQPNLPSAMDMPKSSDFQTGNTRLGPDGRMWHEYRTITGYKYWRLDQ
jgi:hypothetical protein